MLPELLPSPHFDERQLPVSLLIMHYTGMQTGKAALDWLRNPASKVSAHYLIEEDGRVFSLVPESQRAWHAGVSYWGGIRDINSASVGIEIVNPGHEWGYRPFPQPQMEAVLALSKEIISRHAIAPHHIIGHSDIAPMRKQDPGELFPWQWLAENGVGLWPASGGHPSALSAQELADYGYDLADETAAITAFQRHFRPHSLTGEWDDECAIRLASLLAQR